MEYYDEYISLGGNCEIGFQFRRYGKEPSSLFSWLVSDIDKIIHVLSNDFENFYEFEDLIPYTHNMVKSKVHGLCFHTKMLSSKSLHTNKLEFSNKLEDRKMIYNNEYSKYKHLIKKWNTLTHSSKKVVYFIKDKNYTKEKVLSLETFMQKKYPTHRFKLVWIKEGNKFSKTVITDFSDFVYVRVFSDIHLSWASDLDSWKKIFDCYPIKNINIDFNQEVRERTIAHLESFNVKENYHFRLNFNLVQFFEEIDFLETAKYFITLAKEESSEKFVEDEYLRIISKIENKKLEEEHKIHKYIQNIYTLKNEKEMKDYFIENKLLVWKYENKPLNIKVNKEVRYIRLSLQEKICFHLDEIEVYNIQNENIARNKSLIMSSTYKLKKPVLNQKVMNGTISGVASFHTKTENNPWVVLDLEDYELVTSIKIFNRQGAYSTRALSILVEVSTDLKNWELVFDNYKILKRIKSTCLSVNQKNILESIKSSKSKVIASESIETSLKSLLKLSGRDKEINIQKIIKYVLLLKVKAYYQLKVDISKSTNKENELYIINSVVRTFLGENLIFTIEDGLKKNNSSNKVNSYISFSSDTKEKIIIFLSLLNTYDINSEKFNFIKYAILSKYKVISRLTRELKQSKNKENTNRLITKGIELIYGKGYVLTQHGIKKSIDNNYTVEDKIKIVKGINFLFKMLKDKLNIDAYIASGTLLGAVRTNEFISYDDDFDTAYISNEVLYPNIWIETLQILNVLPFKVNPIVGGLLHVKVDLDIVFKLDLFTGWIENGYFYRYPLLQKILKEEDIRPLEQTNLYGELISIPCNADAVLSNNYGKNWKVPDPMWRFDWKTANKEYEGKLFSLKEKLPNRQWVFDNLPLLDENITLNKDKINIKSLIASDVEEELSNINIDDKEITIILENYFLDTVDVQHKVLIDFIHKNLNYNIRYVGKLNKQSVVLTIKKDQI